MTVWVIVSVVIFTNHLGISPQTYRTAEACQAAIGHETEPGKVFYCGAKYETKR